jgi:hypothetical protein
VFLTECGGPALTAHGSLDLKQEIQIQIQTECAGLVFLLALSVSQKPQNREN